MKEIVVASGNSGKIKEVQEIFGNEFKVISIKNFEIDINIEENENTFEKNALKKAETIAKKLNNGMWVLADDSGIEVKSLNNFPGVLTKRWFDGTDRERNLALIQKLDEKLLENNKKIGINSEEKIDNNREVNFVTAIAISNGKDSFCELGILRGIVAKSPKGENGFGFDEIFELENGKTLAELSNEEKNEISARKIAIEKIKKKLI